MQTSVFIAFTGDSPSGLEASNQKEVKVDYKEPTYNFVKYVSKFSRDVSENPGFLQLCDRQ